ncbi:MAG: LysM peptidoglycan-binding domain-containing protein [Clostridia bacterium]|nr:LysM peptidoglycan-binding domain-containing protein [Clostridia bacterium]
MLKLDTVNCYRIKSGQTLSEIAAAFSVSERLIVKENGLTEPPKTGVILKIPAERGNGYTVRAGDTKTLLCGSAENYEKKNGTAVFYIGMKVRI